METETTEVTKVVNDEQKQSKKEIEHEILSTNPDVLVNAARGIIENPKVQQLAECERIQRERVNPQGREQYPEEPQAPMPDKEVELYRTAIQFVTRNLEALYPDLFFGRGQPSKSVDECTGILDRGLRALDLVTSFAEQGKRASQEEPPKPNTETVATITGTEE